MRPNFGAAACCRRPRHASILQMRVTGIILIISLTTVPCAGMEISRVTGCAGGDVLKLRGDIEAGDYVKFGSYFADHRRIAGRLEKHRLGKADPAQIIIAFNVECLPK